MVLTTRSYINTGIAMPFAPSPGHHHFYGWYKPSKMGGLWHCYSHIIHHVHCSMLHCDNMVEPRCWHDHFLMRYWGQAFWHVQMPLMPFSLSLSRVCKLDLFPYVDCMDSWIGMELSQNNLIILPRLNGLIVRNIKLVIPSTLRHLFAVSDEADEVDRFSRFLQTISEWCENCRRPGSDNWYMSMAYVGCVCWQPPFWIGGQVYVLEPAGGTVADCSFSKLPSASPITPQVRTEFGD